MRPFEDSQKNAMREAMERVFSWKQEHTEEYRRILVLLPGYDEGGAQRLQLY